MVAWHALVADDVRTRTESGVVGVAVEEVVHPEVVEGDLLALLGACVGEVCHF